MNPRLHLLQTTLLLATLAAIPPAARLTAQTSIAPTDTSSRAIDADIDPAIAKVIAATPAFDNHAHPVLPPPADTTDRGFDALPVDSMEPQTDPVALRDSNPQLAAAWRVLWGFDAVPPLDAAGMKQLKSARTSVRQREGQNFDTYVLRQAGIGTQVANRVAMGPGLPTGKTEPNFRWVPYADALLFPLNNSALAAETPDRAAFFPLEEKLRARYLKEAGLTSMPATLDEYLHNLVTPTLERQRSAGAIAEKFEIAYLRPFGFADVPQAEAASIYAQYVGHGEPDTKAYKALQDFLFRYVAAECGRLGMPVHLHTMSGAGGYFDIAGANPLLLEPLFNDPRLRKTRFVLLHGGWPFVGEATSVLQKPNVYLDLSQESLTFSPRTLSTWLRERLETYPDKVLFGTDGYPYSDSLGWEESTWIAAHNARTALGLALTGMLHDGEVDEAGAAKLARMVLRDNALALYSREKTAVDGSR